MQGKLVSHWTRGMRHSISRLVPETALARTKTLRLGRRPLGNTHPFNVLHGMEKD